MTGGGDIAPASLDLDRERGLTVVWRDGTRSFYPIALLRRMSPSADMRDLRERMRTDPLTVLPNAGGPGGDAPLRATHAELVGNYAIRVTFSDGHRTGIYSWAYLRSIDPDQPTPDNPPQPRASDGPTHDRARGEPEP